jgi:LmbE family N-acetylglucosaminyl deacetylase
VAFEEPTWGLVEPSELTRIAVVSPHFDDGVLGAAHLLSTYAGSSVVTVFGGWPPAYPSEPTSWDAAGGFQAGDDVVAVRRLEDDAALALLDASAVRLGFADHQYLVPDERPTAEQVAPALEEALVGIAPTAVFLPMGLANPDHVVTHDAGLRVRDAHRDLAWFCYEDHGYKHLPGLLAWRVAKLLRSGLWATPAVVPIQPDMARKREAIACYRSQVAPLERDHVLSERLDANVPEQFWRLAPPPRGWEALADLI